MTIEDLQQQVLRAIDQAAAMYYRLVLVVAPAGGGKTAALREVAEQTRAPYINLSLELSTRLLGLTERQRALYVPKIIDEIGGAESRLILLDNIEMLFEPSLRQEPLGTLQGWSRRRTIVATWSGSVEDGYLSYAEPGHPEYKRYQAVDMLIVGS